MTTMEQSDCGCGHCRLLPVSLCAVCTERGPETLLQICFKYIIDNIHLICNDKTVPYKLHEGVVFPSEICDQLLKCFQRYDKISNNIIGIFSNFYSTRLKHVVLHNTNITDASLEIMLQHKLIELDLSKCTNLTHNSAKLINQYGDSLVVLAIREGVPIIPTYPFIFILPKLKRFTFHAFDTENVYTFNHLLAQLKNLVHLDLSECSMLGEMTFLAKMPLLTSLVLYKVPRLQLAFPYISQLKNLVHLDISQSPLIGQSGFYQDENRALWTLIENMPQLNSLDISGTNLAGSGVAEEGYTHLTDIIGLGGRVSRPLEFLGLYGTHFAACRRHDIPARMVAGDASEEQILVAAAAYLERADVLQRVLNDLYHMFRYETCQYIGHVLSVVLESMDRHPLEKHIQISGSATLFYVIKGKEKNLFGVRIKRHIITTLLNAMYHHKDDETMMRNGCLALCQFKIPQDVLFEYERLVKILLHSASDKAREIFVQRIAIYLLNSLACQVDGRQKLRLGDLGVINKMLSIIEERLDRNLCDDVMDVAWSTMWNVTDETPLNCQRFLEAHGMKYFLKCLQQFPGKEELLRNMMGLLGNVAEVKSLRSKLLTGQYIMVFTKLLESNSDGIEVSYNAAGVLAHLASDGPSVWMLNNPKRQEVMDRITEAIERWDLSTERNINYRSFEPILNLVQEYHSPACQHWAVWALANLTTVYPTKYCSLVQSEGGITLLQELIAHEKPPNRVKQLAKIVIKNCTTFFDFSSNYVETDAPLDG